MAMSVGNHHGPQSEMNVVPLIDIVLVLLIIFMVATPTAQRLYDMSIPEKAPATQDEPPPGNPDQMMVRIRGDQVVLLNKEEIEPTALTTRLKELLTGRRQKIVFFDAANNVNYQFAVDVMDSIRAADGIVGLVTTEL